MCSHERNCKVSSNLSTSLTLCSAASAACDLSFTFGRFNSAAYNNVSLTVSVGNKLSNCSTYAAQLFKTFELDFFSPTKIFPSNVPCVFLPAMTSNKVVFPAPLGPMSAVTRHGWNTTDTSFNNLIISFFFVLCFTLYDTFCTTTGKRMPVIESSSTGLLNQSSSSSYTTSSGDNFVSSSSPSMFTINSPAFSSRIVVESHHSSFVNFSSMDANFSSSWSSSSRSSFFPKSSPSSFPTPYVGLYGIISLLSSSSPYSSSSSPLVFAVVVSAPFPFDDKDDTPSPKRDSTLIASFTSPFCFDDDDPTTRRRLSFSSSSSSPQKAPPEESSFVRKRVTEASSSAASSFASISRYIFLFFFVARGKKKAFR